MIQTHSRVAPDWHAQLTELLRRGSEELISIRLRWINLINICPAIRWNSIKLSQAALDAMVSEKGF